MQTVHRQSGIGTLKSVFSILRPLQDMISNEVKAVISLVADRIIYNDQTGGRLLSYLTGFLEFLGFLVTVIVTWFSQQIESRAYKGAGQLTGEQKIIGALWASAQPEVTNQTAS
jgi:Zn-dependent protease with chaperone function